MAVSYISNRLKALVLIIIGAFRRALCCFRRRRRSSGDTTPLTGVGIGESIALEMGGEQDWKSWDAPMAVVSERNNSVSLIQQQIENYRQQAVAVPDNEPEPDLFQDMIPRITAQPRVILRSEQADPFPPTSRLGIAFDPALAATSELESWEDNPTSWEATDGDGIDPDEMLREKRRAERERRRAEQQSRRATQDRYGGASRGQQALGARNS